MKYKVFCALYITSVEEFISLAWQVLEPDPPISPDTEGTKGGGAFG